MDEIERSTIFRGISHGTLEKRDFIELFADLFDTMLYKKLRGQPSAQPLAHTTYTDNASFWHEILKRTSFQGTRISLHGFHLSEWIPSAPGRYFTPDATRARKAAMQYEARYFDRQKYLPLGKECMILGGVGSVRLGAKNNLYFLGASSTGISHQGIPVALSESDYNKVIPIIKHNGGCFANLMGSLHTLPTSLALIQYDRQIPRYYLLIDDIEIIRPSIQKELLITVAVMFAQSHLKKHNLVLDGYITDFDKSWAFCSFQPDLKDENLDAATSWLSEYACRYSRMDNPPILGDFDEHYQHFRNPVEFPLADISNRGFNTNLLKEYQRIYYISVNIDEYQTVNFDQRKGTFVSGDHINMSGTFQNVNVKSHLENVTQNVSTLPNTDQNTKDELVRLIAQLNEVLQQLPSDKATDAEKISKRVDTLVEEAQKPNPDKEEVEFNLNSLKKVATSVAELIPAILPIATQIATHIGNIIH